MVLVIVLVFALVVSVLSIGGFLLYQRHRRGRPYAQPPDQTLDTNPLMGSQPSSLKELYDWSQSGSGSGELTHSRGSVY